jgi:hypothetical protein
MKRFLMFSTLALTLLVAACATKGAPHKLQTSAPGDNAAPTTSTY